MLGRISLVETLGIAALHSHAEGKRAHHAERTRDRALVRAHRVTHSTCTPSLHVPFILATRVPVELQVKEPYPFILATCTHAPLHTRRCAAWSWRVMEYGCFDVLILIVRVYAAVTGEQQFGKCTADCWTCRSHLHCGRSCVASGKCMHECDLLTRHRLRHGRPPNRRAQIKQAFERHGQNFRVAVVDVKTCAFCCYHGLAHLPNLLSQMLCNLVFTHIQLQKCLAAAICYVRVCGWAGLIPTDVIMKFGGNG